MFNLNFKLFNTAIFVTSIVYLTIIFTPIYDLTSISENGVYFLYFILGYLIFYVITILKLVDVDLFSGKNSIYVEFLKNLFFNKIKILKKMENFYNDNFKFFTFFINIFLTFFFLIFLKKEFKFHDHDHDFFFYYIFFDNYIFDNDFVFEKVFLLNNYD